MSRLDSARLSSALVLSCVLGCGEAEGARGDLAGTQVSGSRLQALAWSSEQGPTVYGKALYDSERGEFCSFRQARDRSYRCFPIAAAPQVFGGNAECPEPLAGTGAISSLPRAMGPLSPPRYVEAGESDCRGATYEIYEAGPEFPRESACAFELASFSALYQRGPRVPDDAFVRAELVVSTETGAPLGAQYFAAVDGASQWFTFFDPAHGEPCLIRYLDDDARHCIPRSTLDEIVSWGSATGVDPAVCRRLIAEGNSCGPSTFGLYVKEMHRVVPAADVVGTSFDTATFGECLLAAPDFVRDPYALTEAIEPEAFPSMAEIEVASGLLRRTVWGTSDGTVLEPVDDQRPLTNGDYYCSLAVAVDGKLRCLPETRTNLFADSECSQPLLIVPEPSARYVRVEREDARTAIYAAGELFSTEVYTKTRSGLRVVCEPSSTKIEPPLVLHRGAEVPPEEFVEYTQVILRQ